MDTLSRHVLAEYHDCDREILNDPVRLEPLMRQAAAAAGVTVVGVRFHRFSPQGVSGVLVIEESHLSIHTWPESGYAAADFFTCGDCHPEKAPQVLGEGLGAGRSEVMVLQRGISGPGPSIAVTRHDVPESTGARSRSRSPGR